MSLTVQQGIPVTLIIGDAVSFKVTDNDHPATGWTSQIVFKLASGSSKTFAGAPSGADHLFALTNANTATLSAGRALVALVFSDGTNRQTSDWQEINILEDPTAPTKKTFAQTQVELLQGAIAKLNASPRSSVNFNGQSFSRANILDYQKQLTYWQARVLSEQKKVDAERGISTNRRIPIQFVRP